MQIGTTDQSLMGRWQVVQTEAIQLLQSAAPDRVGDVSADTRTERLAGNKEGKTGERTQQTQGTILNSTDVDAESNSGESIPLSFSSSVRDYLGSKQLSDSGFNSENDPGLVDGSSGGAAQSGETETDDSSSTSGLTEEEQQQVDELKSRDQEVRQHEQAHLAAAGNLANGGAQFEYQTGPDGKNYAIGGHVNIDTSPENTPQATINKAKQIQRAAMAPADPSPQDVKVAARAMQMLMEAQREISESGSESTEGDDTATGSISPDASRESSDESAIRSESDDKGSVDAAPTNSSKSETQPSRGQLEDS